jgi:hypothetical protein
MGWRSGKQNKFNHPHDDFQAAFVVKNQESLCKLVLLI